MEKQYKFLIIGFISLILGGFIGALCFPTIENVEVEKIVEVPVNVTETLLVDNQNLNLVLKHILDNDGRVQYLVDDLDDDEFAFITDRVILINQFRDMSITAIKEELFDELDNEIYEISGESVKFDEDDLERLRIDDDQDEIVVDEINFEDGDAELILTGRFEQDDIKYDYSAVVKFKDFKFDEVDDIEVTLHE